MSTLREISEGYREAAVMLRMQYDMLREQIERGEDAPELRYAMGRIGRILQELRALRALTRDYYTAARPPEYTTAGLKARRIHE